MSRSKNKLFITIVTGSRAEYGLLVPLLKKFKISKRFHLTLLITGQHLSSKYGNTYKDIIKDNYYNNYKLIDIEIKSSIKNSVTKSLSKSILKFGKYFQKNHTDILLILGDRYEILGVATSAYLNGVRIAHIHGGEKTIGSLDDAFRHSITKFSNYHFVSTNEYKKRVIQLGENKKNIIDVGSLGCENIKKINLIQKQKLNKILKIYLKKRIFLVTFNSENSGPILINKMVSNTIDILKKFKDSSYIFTIPNHDVGADIIKIKISKFVKDNKNAYLFRSLGFKNYISLAKISDCVIGNSSSGILEVPFLKVPTINIGNRQTGRVMPLSVISCDIKKNSIYRSIIKALSVNFKKKIKKQKNPYFKNNTAKNIFNFINDIDYDKTNIKVFEDLKINEKK